MSNISSFAIYEYFTGKDIPTFGYLEVTPNLSRAVINRPQLRSRVYQVEEAIYFPHSSSSSIFTTTSTEGDFDTFLDEFIAPIISKRPWYHLDLWTLRKLNATNFRPFALLMLDKYYHDDTITNRLYIWLNLRLAGRKESVENILKEPDYSEVKRQLISII